VDIEPLPLPARGKLGQSRVGVVPDHLRANFQGHSNGRHRHVAMFHPASLGHEQPAEEREVGGDA
jgi:hypothetical protein